MVHAARGTVVLVPHVADAIPGPQPRVFLGQIECIENSSRAQDVERALGEAVHPLHGLVMVERAPKLIELTQE